MHKMSNLQLRSDSGNGDPNLGLLVPESGYGCIIQQGRSLSSSAVPSASNTPASDSGISSGVTGNITSSRSLPAGTLVSPATECLNSSYWKYYGRKPQVGAIESFALDNAAPSPQQQVDFKMFDRGNLIAASKYPKPTPKPTDNVTAPKLPEKLPFRGGSLPDPKYYAAPSGSPTHSLSLSVSSKDSAQSNSPRTSITGAVYDNLSCKGSISNPCPVYENLDVYSNKPTAQAQYYQSENSGVPHYESGYHKAQPQVPSGVKYAPQYSSKYPPYEAPPVYENIQNFHSQYNTSHHQAHQQSTQAQNYSPAKPGPQVPGPTSYGETRQMALPLSSPSSSAPAQMSYYPSSVSSKTVSSQPITGQTSSSSSGAGSLPPPPPYNNGTPPYVASPVSNGYGSFPSRYQSQTYTPVSSCIMPGSVVTTSTISSLSGSGDYVVMSGVAQATSYQRAAQSGVASVPSLAEPYSRVGNPTTSKII